MLVPPQGEVVGPLQILLPCPAAVHRTLLSGGGTSQFTIHETVIDFKRVF